MRVVRAIQVAGGDIGSVSLNNGVYVDMDMDVYVYVDVDVYVYVE